MLRPLLGMFLLTLSWVSQAHTITGKVTDKINRPKPGAHVVNSRVQHHSHSDITGYFKMGGVQLQDTIYVSQLGYQPVTFIIDEFDKQYAIELIETLINHEEAVISPSIDPLNLISSINVKTLPVNNSQEVLRQVPGLFIGYQME